MPHTVVNLTFAVPVPEERSSIRRCEDNRPPSTRMVVSKLDIVVVVGGMERP